MTKEQISKVERKSIVIILDKIQCFYLTHYEDDLWKLAIDIVQDGTQYTTPMTLERATTAYLCLDLTIEDKDTDMVSLRELEGYGEHAGETELTGAHEMVAQWLK